MSRRLVLALAGALVALGAPRISVAAEDAGTLSPFAAGAGCRALALGGAFVAIADDATGLAWNAAGLARATRSGFEVAHADRTGLGAAEEYVAIVLPNWRWGTAAISIHHLGVGGVERRDDRNVLLDGEISDSETEITLGYARPLGEAWHVGGAVKLQRQSLAGFSAGAIGADAGVLVALGPALGGLPWLEGVTWGLAARNLIVPSLRLDRESAPDPRLWRTGLAWHDALGGLPDVRLALDVDQASGVAPHLHAGAEVRLHPLLVLRGGSDGGHVTAGAGVSWHDLDVSYAFQDGPMGSTHRIGLARAFGSTVAANREAAHRANENAIQARLDEEFQRRRSEQLNRLLTRAQAALAEGAFDNAIEILVAATMLDSTDVRVRSLEARAHRELGANLERAGDDEAAAVAFGRALAIAPTDTAARNGQQRAREAYQRRAARDATRRERFEAALGAFASDDLATARSGFAALAASDLADSESVSMLHRVDQAIARRVADVMRSARQSLDAQATDEAARLLSRARALDPKAAGLADLESALAERRRLAPGLPPAPTAVTRTVTPEDRRAAEVGSSRVDLQACKLEYSIVSPK